MQTLSVGSRGCKSLYSCWVLQLTFPPLATLDRTLANTLDTDFGQRDFYILTEQLNKKIK